MIRLFDVQVRHLRATPVRHEISRRGVLWFADVEELPRLPGPLKVLGRIDPKDYLGEGQSLRDRVCDFVVSCGQPRPVGAVTMLTDPRSFGYSFNPLTLFWCHDGDGQVSEVVAEVHNTYGQRHRYLLPAQGTNAPVDKAFTVSPFYPVDGHYRINAPEPKERLDITITLHRPSDAAPFVASLRGSGRSVSTSGLIAAGLRHPAQSLRVRAAIQMHGIRLLLKGLPIVSRREHAAGRGQS